MTAKLETHAEQLGALAHPVRLSILRYLVQGDSEGTAAGEIQSRLDIPASTLSHHLDRLSSAGLIAARRDGTFIYYRVEFTALKALTDYLWQDCCKSGRVNGKNQCC